MTDPERGTTGQSGDDDRTVGRRTVLGVSLAGLAGVGLAGTASSQDDLQNELWIYCEEDEVEYTFEVDGQVAMGSDAGDRDEITDGTTVTGYIEARGQDNYNFSGDVVSFEITKGANVARVVLNGQEVDPDGLGSSEGSVNREFPHEITLAAKTDRVSYELAVDGRITQGQGGGGEIEEDRRVTATLAGDDEHTYRFWGIATWLEVTEGVASFDVALTDDGSTAADRLPHRLLVYGLDEDPVSYRFSVTDAVEFGDAAEQEPSGFPPERRVAERTVEGHVHAHGDDPLADDFRFAGSLTFERAEGPIRVKLKPNDEREEQSGSNE